MSVGIWQLVLILIIVFVLFGAGKLPTMMGDLGKGIRNLKEGLKGKGEANAESPQATKDEEKVIKEAIKDAKQEEQKKA